MRVTLVSYDGEPPLGGQGVLARGMAAALRDRGVEVTRLTGHGDGAARYARVTRRAPLDLSLELSRHPARLLHGRPDLVHAMGGPGGVLLLRRVGVPVVCTANHTYRQAYPGWAPRRALSLAERRAYRLAAVVLAISPSTADAVAALGVPASRIEVVYPGVDVAQFDVGESLREPGRLLFVGRLLPEKGPLDAVAAMRQLSQRRPGVTGAVVGTGVLLAAVGGAAAGTPVEVLGGLDDAAVATQYARAAVVLVPSRYEGLGLVALEAMAAGAAVVAYDVTGLRDAVAGAGVLVDPLRGVAGLVAAATELLDDDARRAEFAERGRRHVRERHSWAGVGERVEAVYRAVLAGR